MPRRSASRRQAAVRPSALQPRCDFDCTGCYLGAEGNRPAGRSASPTSWRSSTRCAVHLGPKGNVQITDGEGDPVCRSPTWFASCTTRVDIGLIPMLMTHGDHFRRDPDLLERLVVDGGLSEVGIHVDTTQRGTTRGTSTRPRVKRTLMRAARRTRKR